MSLPAALSTLQPPLLDPAEAGSFARYTVLQRLPATAKRILQEGGVPSPMHRDNLMKLVEEIPDGLLRAPEHVDCSGMPMGGCRKGWAHFNHVWDQWAATRASSNWQEALPLICTEIYFYRRVLDATGYFREGESYLVDPFAGQKQASLTSALQSEALIQAVGEHWDAVQNPRNESRLRGLFQTLLLADLWSNQGDLALAPADLSNVDRASTISTSPTSRLMVDESAHALDQLLTCPSGLNGGARIDMVLDNSGIELLCDLLLADSLLAHELAQTVRLHVKGEPLFVSDAMPTDVASHVAALEGHTDARLAALGKRLSDGIGSGSLQIRSHMFWTTPRLFWEMPVSLASELREASLVLIKGDANYRRLIGDRRWNPLTPLAKVLRGWFPAPALVLRTFKAEVAVGLKKVSVPAVRFEGGQGRGILHGVSPGRP